MPLFSIITPCYCFSKQNVLLDKLLLQTESDYELILVDDNSPDETLIALNHFKEMFSSQGISVIILHNDLNMGAGDSRNRAIANSNGEYLLFLDSDDYLDDECLFKLKNVISTNDNPDVVLFDYQTINGKKSKQFKSFKNSGPISVKDAFLFAPNGVCGKCVKNLMVQENNIVFGSQKRNEDYPFFRVCFLKSKSIIYLQEPMYFYVCNQQSLMHKPENANVDYALSAFEMVKDHSNDLEMLSCAFMKNCFYSNIISMLILKYKRKDFYNRLSFLKSNYSGFYSRKNSHCLSKKTQIVILLADSKLFLLLNILFCLMRSFRF